MRKPAWRAYPACRRRNALFGFGHTPAEPGRPFAGARFDRGGVQIALFHGSDEQRCPKNKRPTAPFHADEIAASGATFALTGHFHGGYTIARKDKSPLFAYPGSPEPIKFGETGKHGALAITIDGSKVTVTPFDTARTRLVELTCDLGGASSEHAVIERTSKLLEGFGQNDFVKLTLAGLVMPGTRVDVRLLEERLEPALGALAIEDTTIPEDYEEIAREPTVRGRVMLDLLEVARGPDPERAAEAQRALRYATAAFSGSAIVP